MLNQHDTYEWEQAFYYASFERDDVEHVIAEDEGYNDGDHWISFGKLKNGEYYFMSAWCDYTGWDCQSGGDSWTSKDREELERFRMSDAERARLSIVLPVVDGVGPL